MSRFFCALALALTTINAQPPPLPVDRIDELFNRWNASQTHGFAVGVIRDGRLDFA